MARTLVDGCDNCRYSLVYCQAMLTLVDHKPCCESCSHTRR